MPLALATGLFVSLATIQAPDGLSGPSGAASNTYVNVNPPLVDIPCMDAPTSDVKIQANTVEQLQELESYELRHVLLNGWYPQLENGVGNGWRCVITDSVSGLVNNFQIMGAEADSQNQMTRLELKLATI
jgi:hypothetical protein